MANTHFSANGCSRPLHNIPEDSNPDLVWLPRHDVLVEVWHKRARTIQEMDVLSDQDPAGHARLALMLRQLDADLVRISAQTAAEAAVKAAWLRQQLDLSDAASGEVKLVAEELVAGLINQALHDRREPLPRKFDLVRVLTLVLVLGGCVSVWGAIIASIATFI